MKERHFNLNHWLLKLLALVLAMVSGAALVLGCAGWLVDGPLELYDRFREDYFWQQYYSFEHQASAAVFDHYAWEQSGIEESFFERFYRWGADVDAVEALEQDFYYVITDMETNEQVASNLPVGMDLETFENVDYYEYSARTGRVIEMPKCNYYPSYGEYQDAAYRTQTGMDLPPLGEGITDYDYYVVSDSERVNPSNVYMASFSHSNAYGEEYTIYRLEYGPSREYQVMFAMTELQMEIFRTNLPDGELLPDYVQSHWEDIGYLMLFGGIGLLLSLLWLSLTAGRNPRNREVKAEGLNVIPLDLYLCAAGVGLVLCAGLAYIITDDLIHNSLWGNYETADNAGFLVSLGCIALSGAGAGLIGSMFLMACAAQMKMGNNHWAKNTLIAWCWKLGWKAVTLVWGWCWKLVRACFRAIGNFFRWIWDMLNRFTSLLPLNWQWLIASGLCWILMFLCILMGLETYSIGPILFGILATVLLVLYGAYCFGRLRESAKKMALGDLDTKIEDRFLSGCFGDFGKDLNALSDVCIEAAKQQMKSERMKTELITNVSHDIKTPLTSIINYVDLLQKTEDEAERTEYLEVLDRQSQRLKKLIEDLMEMSRASSGNVAIEITPTDICEAVHQALGEFSDTLSACGLQVMLKAPKEPVLAMCDGKHLWRVLSNTLGNVVKYAMPGTRVYVDVQYREGKTEISVKNISRQMLNISADELMERFVRGDTSRNTDGNGLGLNIARSLMEVQGGHLDLVVDGDLFKVVLTLNAAP